MPVSSPANPPQGSKKLDANFEHFMGQLVGDELYERWCTDHPGGGLLAWWPGRSDDTDIWHV